MAAPKVYLSPAMHMANPCVYPRPDGKQCYEALENNEYIDILEPILNRCGIATKRGYRRTPMNSDNGDAIMKQNVRESDAWGADVHYVSHTNAISNGAEQTRVSGCNPMYYTYSSKGKKLGEIMVKYRKQVYPGKVTLVPNAKWYELRVPNAVSYYEEHAFHDNPNDIGWWHEHMTEVAESAAKGLCEWFGIPYVEPEKPAEPETPEQPTVTETYTVKVTRSADGKSGTWEIVK
jgi:N-acetylmuramoyl-L-alanine amidase